MIDGYIVFCQCPPMTKKIEGMLAPALLARYIRERGWTSAILAQILNVQEATVAHWRTGRARPLPHLQHIIYYLCGIPPVDWLDSAEKGAIETMRKEIKRLRKRSPRPDPTLQEQIAGRL